MNIEHGRTNLYSIVPLYLIFQVPPKLAPFSFGDEALSYGDTISITCTISGGDLPVTVEWRLNGSPLESYLEIQTETRGKRINNLVIDLVSAKHAGNYTCFAKNAAGVAEHTSELVVNG